LILNGLSIVGFHSFLESLLPGFSENRANSGEESDCILPVGWNHVVLGSKERWSDPAGFKLAALLNGGMQENNQKEEQQCTQ
jgi:hypothetical protein